MSAGEAEENASAVVYERVLVSLFSGEVAAHVARAKSYGEPMLSAESTFAVRYAPRRRAEFAAGRASGRRALASLGCLGRPILQSEDRSPIWPEGFVGSISHCEEFCGAVAARTSDLVNLGLDAEPARALPRELMEIVCTPREIVAVSGLGDTRALCRGQLTFVAKEAFYKCYFPLTKTFLDFQDVEVTFRVASLHEGSFSVRLVDSGKPYGGRERCFVGRWAWRERHVFAGVTVPLSI